jgi:hypothetical protein
MVVLDAKDQKSRTTSGIPTWSPTVVLTGPDDAYNFAEQTGSGAVIVVWSFLLQPPTSTENTIQQDNNHPTMNKSFRMLSRTNKNTTQQYNTTARTIAIAIAVQVACVALIDVVCTIPVFVPIFHSNFQCPQQRNATTQQCNTVHAVPVSGIVPGTWCLDNNKEMQEPSLLLLLPALCLLLPSELRLRLHPKQPHDRSKHVNGKSGIRHPLEPIFVVAIAASSPRRQLVFVSLGILSCSFLLSTQNVYTNTFCVDLHRLCSVAPLVARLESGVAAVNVAVAGSVVAV